MRSGVKLIVTTVFAVIVIAAIATQGHMAATAPMTVGDFAAIICNYGNTGTPVATSQAVDKLRRLGVPLGDPKAALTEKKLSAILNFYGVRAKTSSPNSQVDQFLADAAVSMISSTSYFLTGREKSKGTPVSGSIGVCLSERNTGKCINCCKDQGTPASLCAAFCNDRPPSESEPSP